MGKKPFNPQAFEKAKVSSKDVEGKRQFLSGASHREEELGPEWNNDPEQIQQELEDAHKKKLAWSHAPKKEQDKREFLVGAEHRDESFGSDFNNDPEELQKEEKGKYKKKGVKGPSFDR
jgi:hypothetical protein